MWLQIEPKIWPTSLANQNLENKSLGRVHLHLREFGLEVVDSGTAQKRQRHHIPKQICEETDISSVIIPLAYDIAQRVTYP